MYFLIEVCQNPGVLRALYFIDLLINALFVIVPISLIIMLLVDFFRATISNDDTAKKSAKMAGKRIISAVLVFCVPWIVNVLMELLTSAGFQTGYLVYFRTVFAGNMPACYGSSHGMLRFVSLLVTTLCIIGCNRKGTFCRMTFFLVKNK